MKLKRISWKSSGKDSELSLTRNHNPTSCTVWFFLKNCMKIEIGHWVVQLSSKITNSTLKPSLYPLILKTSDTKLNFSNNYAQNITSIYFTGWTTTYYTNFYLSKKKEDPPSLKQTVDTHWCGSNSFSAGRISPGGMGEKGELTSTVHSWPWATWESEGLTLPHPQHNSAASCHTRGEDCEALQSSCGQPGLLHLREGVLGTPRSSTCQRGCHFQPWHLQRGKRCHPRCRRSWAAACRGLRAGFLPLNLAPSYSRTNHFPSHPVTRQSPYPHVKLRPSLTSSLH